MGAPPYPVQTIARWFVAWSDQTGDDQEGPISNLKLQKLLYYAQGHYLAATGGPLFSEPIQAWSHGPVVAPVYHEYKEFGRGEIDLPEDAFSWDEVDPDTTNFLIKVWNTYGQYAAWRLRNMTHAEPPWQRTFDTHSFNLEISKDVMREYFAGLRPITS